GVPPNSGCRKGQIVSTRVIWTSQIRRTRLLAARSRGKTRERAGYVPDCGSLSRSLRRQEEHGAHGHTDHRDQTAADQGPASTELLADPADQGSAHRGATHED